MPRVLWAMSGSMAVTRQGARPRQMRKLVLVNGRSCSQDGSDAVTAHDGGVTVPPQELAGTRKYSADTKERRSTRAAGTGRERNVSSQIRRVANNRPATRGPRNSLRV
jgi:hypothetical protein